MDRYILTYTYDSGVVGQRWCDMAETAEELANHLLGCQTAHGTITNVRVIHRDQVINEFEY